MKRTYLQTNNSKFYLSHARFSQKISIIESTQSIKNETAIQSFNDIITGKKLWKKFQSFKQPELIVQRTIDIYNSICDEKNSDTMNSLIKLFMQFNQPHKVNLFWDDIINTVDISYPLLLKCCVYQNPK
eukprot:75577_1